MTVLVDSQVSDRLLPYLLVFGLVIFNIGNTDNQNDPDPKVKACVETSSVFLVKCTLDDQSF